MQLPWGPWLDWAGFFTCPVKSWQVTENIAGIHKIASSVSLGPAFISGVFQTFSIFLNAVKVCYSTLSYRIMSTRNIEVEQRSSGKRECVYLLLPSSGRDIYLHLHRPHFSHWPVYLSIYISHVLHIWLSFCWSVQLHHSVSIWFQSVHTLTTAAAVMTQRFCMQPVLSHQRHSSPVQDNKLLLFF